MPMRTEFRIAAPGLVTASEKLATYFWPAGDWTNSVKSWVEENLSSRCFCMVFCCLRRAVTKAMYVTPITHPVIKRRTRKGPIVDSSNPRTSGACGRLTEKAFSNQYSAFGRETYLQLWGEPSPGASADR